MTSYYVHGVELVNAGGESCCACDRPAIGYLNAHPICKRHAGWAAVEAEELAQEIEASRARRADRDTRDRARIRRLMLADEAQPGDSRRRQNGVRNAAARKNNTPTDRPSSPRAAYDREWYRRNRERKIAQVKARQALRAA